MKKTLYIISKPLDDDMKAILSSPLPPAHSISAILIQKGTLVVPSTHIPIFALENDIQKDDITGSYSKIQYSDMLNMIFEADTVISI